MPSAIAPERHEHDLRAGALQRRRSRPPSGRPRRDRGRGPSLVTRLEPTLTTSRFARLRRPCVMSRRDAPLASASRAGARRPALASRRPAASRCRSAPASGSVGTARCASSQSWIANTSSRHPSPLIAAIANTGPFQRYAFTNAATRFSRSSSGTQVELVQHEPARLLVQRLVVLRKLLDDRARVVHRIGIVVEAARCRRHAAAGACAAGGAGTDDRGRRLRRRLR